MLGLLIRVGPWRRFLLGSAFGLIFATALACGTDTTVVNTPTELAPTTTVTSQVEDPLARFEENKHGWSVVSDGIDIVLATPDLGVGPQRFALVLSDDEGIIKFPVVEFTSYQYMDGYESEPGEAKQTVFARFAEFPFGTRGIHVTELDFNAAGAWSVEANVPRSDGTSVIAEVRFEVAENPQSIAVGEQVPPSHNRTLDDVSNVSELTTGSFYDEELYRYTVADALERDRPFVVVFASPAFCTNAVCGPQVEVVSELRETYAEHADFIHVDLFTNPQEIQGDLTQAIETELLDEWGLVSQEWTYVVGSDGRVAARFENFAGAAELSEAIEMAIDSAANA